MLGQRTTGREEEVPQGSWRTIASGRVSPTARGQIEPMGRWEGVDPSGRAQQADDTGKKGTLERDTSRPSVPLGSSGVSVSVITVARSHGRTVAWWGARWRGRRGSCPAVGTLVHAHWTMVGTAATCADRGACGVRSYAYKDTRDRSELELN